MPPDSVLHDILNLHTVTPVSIYRITKEIDGEAVPALMAGSLSGWNDNTTNFMIIDSLSRDEEIILKLKDGYTILLPDNALELTGTKFENITSDTCLEAARYLRQNGPGWNIS